MRTDNLFILQARSVIWTFALRMQGEHQCENAAAALMVLELLRQYMAFMLDDNDIALGLENAFWAGRLEKVVDQPRIVLDGAHNPEGAESLAKSIIGCLSAQQVNFDDGYVGK